ncbi:hypothetical protein BKA93DRAFT_463308 [Sparassis latifolia]
MKSITTTSARPTRKQYSPKSPSHTHPIPRPLAAVKDPGPDLYRQTPPTTHRALNHRRPSIAARKWFGSRCGQRADPPNDLPAQLRHEPTSAEKALNIPQAEQRQQARAELSAPKEENEHLRRLHADPQ